MLIGENLPFIKEYVASVNAAIKQHDSGKQLSKLQCYWLSFVILGLLLTNSLCWKRYERFSVGKQTAAGLSWMFCRAKLAWELLLQASIMHILSVYGIKTGVLVIDDTDKERSKNTTQIAKVHKIRDKKRSGYFNGQNIVFLVLVSKELTLPVGFYFYEPDPKMVAWRKEENRLKEKGVAKKHRPSMPAYDSNYPNKKDLALKLLTNFMNFFEDFKVKAVTSDILYGTEEFISDAIKITKQPQIITQIKKNQLINVNGRNVTASDFFQNYHGKTENQELRSTTKNITYCSGKFKVKSHDKKYYIIALKYDDESDYRYLIASDMTWRDVDIIKAFALRWLVEVFIQDWKLYEGWNQLAKQRGNEGSDRGVTLSLLCDHALSLHHDQLALFKNGKPACTVGSLRQKVMVDSLNAFIKNIVNSENPKEMFEEYSRKLSSLFELQTSIKHMRHIDFAIFQPAEN